MTDYNVSANLTDAGNDTATQNFDADETIRVTITGIGTIATPTTSNCTATFVSLSTFYGIYTYKYDITSPSGGGSNYSVVFLQNYQSRTFTLSGSVASVSSTPLVHTIRQRYSGFYDQTVTEQDSNVAVYLAYVVSRPDSSSPALPTGSHTWTITRNSGSEAITNDFVAASTSVSLGNITVSGVSNAYGMYITMSIIGDSLPELEHQGEAFTITVTNPAGTAVATHTLTLHDNDIDLSTSYSGTIHLTGYDLPNPGSGTVASATEVANINIPITQNQNVNAMPSSGFYRWLKTTTLGSEGAYFGVAAAVSNTSGVVTNNYIAKAYFPNYGETAQYSVAAYNGRNWLEDTSTRINVTRGYNKAVSNGGVIADQTVSGDVTVNVGFNSFGSTNRTGHRFWKLQSSTGSTNPSLGDSRWQLIGTTAAAFSYTQPRGTKYYYSSRWTNANDSVQWLSGTTNNPHGQSPVSESVPSVPGSFAVSQNTAGTVATVSSTLPGTDSVTTTYYIQITTSSFANSNVYTTDSSITTPTQLNSGWQTGTTFSQTPGTTYYYWAVGWTPGVGNGHAASAVTGPLSITANNPTSNPAYNLVQAGSVTTINEGTALQFNVTTTNVSSGTTLYWSLSRPGDFDSPTTGTVSVSGSGTASFTVTPTADTTTEGNETFLARLRTGSQSGTEVATSSAITIVDTSLDPAASTFAIAPPTGVTSVNEGSSITFTITTTNVANSTVLYWALSRPGDFDTGSGNVTISNNTASFTVTPTADVSSNEGAETFTANLRTVSASGSIVATSASVTINDTSVASAGNNTYNYTLDTRRINGVLNSNMNPNSSTYDPEYGREVQNVQLDNSIGITWATGNSGGVVQQVAAVNCTVTGPTVTGTGSNTVNSIVLTFPTGTSVPGYYHYVANTPRGPDTVIFSGTVGTPPTPVNYGLEVYNADATLAISRTSRLARFHTQGTATLTYNTPLDVTITGMANDESWSVIMTTPIIVTSQQAHIITATKSANKVRFLYTVPSGTTAPNNSNAWYTKPIAYLILRV